MCVYLTIILILSDYTYWICNNIALNIHLAQLQQQLSKHYAKTIELDIIYEPLHRKE